MIDEISALHTSGTWELISLHVGKSTVGYHQVYAIKVGPDGKVDRLMVHLIAKGYTQISGLDYGDTSLLWLKQHMSVFSMHGCCLSLVSFLIAFAHKNVFSPR